MNRVLLCSSRVFAGRGDVLDNYLLNRNVLALDYDWDTTQDLTALFAAAVAAARRARGGRVVSVGLMFHSAASHALKLFAHDRARSTDNESSSDFEDFADFVRLLTIVFPNLTDVDIMSCRTVGATNRTVFNVLGARLGVRINAAVNDEGANGDWVLGEGDVDMVGRYFKRNIRKSGLVLTQTTISWFSTSYIKNPPTAFYPVTYPYDVTKIETLQTFFQTYVTNYSFKSSPTQSDYNLFASVCNKKLQDISADGSTPNVITDQNDQNFKYGSLFLCAEYSNTSICPKGNTTLSVYESIGVTGFEMLSSPPPYYYASCTVTVYSYAFICKFYYIKRPPVTILNFTGNKYIPKFVL